MQTCSELKETSFGVSGKPKTKKVSFATVYFFDSTEKITFTANILIYFWHRRGILSQMYLGDFVQGPVFPARITWLSCSSWKSALSAAAAAVQSLPSPRPLHSPGHPACLGTALHKKGLCRSTELLSVPGMARAGRAQLGHLGADGALLGGERAPNSAQLQPSPASESPVLLLSPGAAGK